MRTTRQRISRLETQVGAADVPAGGASELREIRLIDLPYRARVRVLQEIMDAIEAGVKFAVPKSIDEALAAEGLTRADIKPYPFGPSPAEARRRVAEWLAEIAATHGGSVVPHVTGQ